MLCQLSYGHHPFGAGWIRTTDLSLIRGVLWPPELLPLFAFYYNTKAPFLQVARDAHPGLSNPSRLPVRIKGTMAWVCGCDLKNHWGRKGVGKSPDAYATGLWGESLATIMSNGIDKN